MPKRRPTLEHSTKAALCFLAVAAAWLSVASTGVSQLPRTTITSVFPPGGQSGSSIDVVVRGPTILGVDQLVFTHPGIRAEVKKAKRDEFATEAEPLYGQFQVTIGPDVPPGRYEVRAIGAHGLSNPRCFVVGASPEIQSPGSNRSPDQALEVPLETVVNGTTAASQVDYYWVELTAGQRVTVSCQARAIDSRLNAVLSILDDRGIQLAQAFVVERDPVSNELLLRGQGQGHIDIVVERLKNQFKQEVELSPPRVAYRETIRGSVTNVEGKLKKQSGGRGQFGVCYIDMKPAPGQGFVFEDAIVGGVIPRQYIPAVQKGIEEAASRGVLAGYPTIDFHVRLFDGKTHPVDSSEQAFKMAGIFAFRNAVVQCRPVLLEPYVNLEVTVPAEYQGEIAGDLNRRRGRLGEPTYRGKNVTIRAKVPESEILTYANQLTSMTEGRGTFTVEFSHYDQVPPEKQKQIVEAYKAANEN